MTREVPIDPFAPTDTAPPLRTGDLDIGRAVADALAAVFRNLLPLLGAILIGGLAYLLSICTCVGWIVGLPLMMWGLYRFLLGIVDGRGEVSAMWSGFDRFGPAFVRMWGITLFYVLVGSPLIGVTILVSLAGGAGAQFGFDPGFATLGPIAGAIVSIVASTLYGFLLVRFVFAPYLVVDRDMDVLDAIRTTWQATSPLWGKLVALQLLLVLLNLPAQALGVGIQILSRESQNDPAAAIDGLAMMSALGMGLYVLLAIAGVIGMAIMSTAYRQVFGKPG